MFLILSTWKTRVVSHWIKPIYGILLLTHVNSRIMFVKLFGKKRTICHVLTLEPSPVELTVLTLDVYP